MCLGICFSSEVAVINYDDEMVLCIHCFYRMTREHQKFQSSLPTFKGSSSQLWLKSMPFVRQSTVMKVNINYDDALACTYTSM